jgi:large repetitive protein
VITKRCIIALFAAAAVAALSACTPSGRTSSSVDAIASLPPTAEARALARIEAAQSLVRPGSEVRVHERLGVPTFLWASEEGAVAGLAALGGGATATALPVTGVAGTAEAAARAHLGVYAPLYGLDAADVASAVVTHVHDIGRGPVVVQLQQSIGGIEVFRERTSVVMDRALRLVAIGGFLSASGSQAFAPSIGSALGATDAAAAALSALGSTAIDAGALSSLGMGEGGYELLVPFAAPAGDPIRAKRIWFHGPTGLVPAWYVEADAAEGERTVLHAHAIAAADGAVLFRASLTSDTGDVINDYTYRVWAAPAGDPANPAAPFDGPQGNAFDPHPSGLVDGTPLPGAVAQVDVSLFASPRFDDPWLPLGAAETTGNNVEAYADLVAPDGFTPGSADFHASVTGPKAFQRTYDAALPNAANQMQAALVQMFYNVNYWHDWYYASGFTESAGNAQANNYGRGGIAGDSIRAEGEDFSGRNNANMNTPADGGRPRMQMFLFDGIAERHLFLTGAITADLATGVPSGFGISSHDVSGAVAWVDDGVGSAAYPPATTTTATVHDGCDFTPPTGGGSWAAVAGKIAFIDRGGVAPPGVPSCGFSDKAFNAQRAGAIGVLIASTTPHAAATAVAMGPATSPPPVITIPVYQLSTPDGDAVRAALGSGLVTARLLRATAVDRDGTIDNQIMAHEWGHYISNRLVANSSGLTTNMARGLGEGWADFHAMLLTVKAADAAVPSNASYAGVYGLALWSTTGGSNGPIGNQGVYFGIRRMPYSTDMTRNSQTFKNIQDSSPIPAGVPFAFWPAPGTTAANGGNSEVHNTGEVWATMLWECYAALLRDTVGPTPRLSFAAARERMKDYLVAAYQITPPQPTLLEARDAVLAAVYAGGDLVDYHAFFSAFAKRGAGAGAVAPDRFSTTNNGVTESFVTGVDIAFVGASIVDDVTSCDRDGILDSGESGHLRVTLRNDTTLSLASTSATVTAVGPNAASVSFPGGNLIGFGATSPLETVTATIPIALAGGLAGEQHIELQLSYGDPALALPNVTTTWSARGNVDDVLAQAQVDDVESSQPRFTAVTLGNTPTPLTGWQRQELTAFQHVYSVADQNGLTDLALVSPAMVAGAGRLGMSFRHRYSFEFSGATLFDGGVVELSADGGNTWTDIGGLVAAGQAYTGALNGGTTLGTRRAFAAISPGYPAFVTSTIDLGSAFAGQTVRVRFRVATDANGRANGWDVDDIAFTGLVTRPFPALLANKCNTGASQPNRVPAAAIALVGPVAERTLVSLAGSGTDADGDALTFQWSQLSGPPVTLSDATSPTPTFVAPDVPAGGGTVVLTLTAFDGTAFSAAVSRSITVTNVDRPPIADAGAAQTVQERSLVQLAGSGVDADGEAVTFAWTQTAGPPVALLDGSSATASFLAPEVTAAGASLSFQLAVSAGGVSTSSSTTVQVTNVNQTPIASAGAGKLVDEGAVVQLDGSGTDADGDTVTYAWTQLSPASPAIALSDATAAAPTFTAPQVAAATAFTFQLVVSDGVAQSPASVVTVVVRDLVRAPTANAGAPQSVDERTPVQLSGGGSDPDGRTLSFLWVQTGGPAVVLSDATAASPSFTAPDVGPGGAVLAFQLVVSAGGATATSTTSVTVRDLNRLPVAVVGPDLHTTSGLEVTLDARSSADPDGQALGYAWTQVLGPAVTLAGAATARPTFTAPTVGASTELAFEVIIADGQGGTASARQRVTVEPASASSGGGKSSGGCSTGGAGSLSLLVLLGLGLRAMARPRRRLSKAR